MNNIISIGSKIITSYPLLLNLIADILEKLKIPFPKKLSEILLIPKKSQFNFIFFFYLIQIFAAIGFFINWYFYQKDNSDIIKTEGYSTKYLIGILVSQLLFCIPIFLIFKKLQKFIV